MLRVSGAMWSIARVVVDVLALRRRATARRGRARRRARAASRRCRCARAGRRGRRARASATRAPRAPPRAATYARVGSRALERCTARAANRSASAISVTTLSQPSASAASTTCCTIVDLGAAADLDDEPRLGDEPLRAAGDEHELERLRDSRAVGHAKPRAGLRVRRVQSRERVSGGRDPRAAGRVSAAANTRRGRGPPDPSLA